MWEIFSALIFVILALFLMNPTGLWMPSMAHVAILAAVTLALGFFALFVLRERSGDERDNEHRSFSGRIAFLAGAATLMCAIIVQTLEHRLDAWLVGALVAMVVGKVAARLYSEWYR